MSIANQISKTSQSRPFTKRPPSSWRYASAGIERRQFPNVGSQLSDEAAELGEAIDRYKFENRIQKIDHEQLLHVMKSIGYSR